MDYNVYYIIWKWSITMYSSTFVIGYVNIMISSTNAHLHISSLRHKKRDMFRLKFTNMKTCDFLGNVWPALRQTSFTSKCEHAWLQMLSVASLFLCCVSNNITHWDHSFIIIAHWQQNQWWTLLNNSVTNYWHGFGFHEWKAWRFAKHKKKPYDL